MIKAVFLAFLPIVLLGTASPARADVTRVDNSSRAPSGYYGNCYQRISGIGSKRDHVKEVGRDPDRAQYIDVLDCHSFDGGGGTRVVTCPSSSSGYTYCLENDNDGSGNHIQLGVVEDTAVPVCQLQSTRGAPIGQIDVLVKDDGTGISHIEFRGGASNALMQEYSTVQGKGEVVVTATKIDSNQGATLGSFIVRDRAGNTVTCGPYSF